MNEVRTPTFFYIPWIYWKWGKFLTIFLAVPAIWRVHAAHPNWSSYFFPYFLHRNKEKMVIIIKMVLEAVFLTLMFASMPKTVRGTLGAGNSSNHAVATLKLGIILTTNSSLFIDYDVLRPAIDLAIERSLIRYGIAFETILGLYMLQDGRCTELAGLGADCTGSGAGRRRDPGSHVHGWFAGGRESDHGATGAAADGRGLLCGQHGRVAVCHANGL